MGNLSILFTGDVMLGRTVNEVLELNDFSWVWGDTLEIFYKADLRLINLECVISSKGTPDPRSYFHFRAKPLAINVLKKAKIDFVSIANNHVLDYGEEALLEMLELLKNNGIAYAGVGKDIEEASRFALLEKKKVKVSIMAFSDHPIWWKAEKGKPGINYLPLNFYKRKEKEKVKKIIKEAKENSDLVIVSCHVGPHYRVKPSKEFIEFAHKLIEFGADIYWGHSNHIPQGIEIYKGKVIFYDTGDFIDDYAVDNFGFFRNDQSFIFVLGLEGKRISRIKLIPVRIDPYKMQVNVEKGYESRFVLHNMKKLCLELGSETYVRKGKLFIDLK